MPIHLCLLQDLAGKFSAEQLAYIATLAVGAPLVFGDRPKRDTFKRFLDVPSLEELDMAFGLQVCLEISPQPRRRICYDCLGPCFASYINTHEGSLLIC